MDDQILIQEYLSEIDANLYLPPLPLSSPSLPTSSILPAVGFSLLSRVWVHPLDTLRSCKMTGVPFLWNMRSLYAGRNFSLSI